MKVRIGRTCRAPTVEVPRGAICGASKPNGGEVKISVTVPLEEFDARGMRKAVVLFMTQAEAAELGETMLRMSKWTPETEHDTTRLAAAIGKAMREGEH